MKTEKIVCVGRSYAAHAAELGNQVPKQPILFLKPMSSVVSVADGIQWNTALGECHYECELVLRLGADLPVDANPEQVLAAIDAVTLGLDLTLRDVQDQLKAKGLPWERAKAFPGACVLADWVNIAEVGDLKHVEYDFFVDDELRQHGDTRLLLFPIAELLLEIHHVFSLKAGDIVMTGTPAGVAALKAGQQLRMILHTMTGTRQWNTWVHTDLT